MKNHFFTLLATSSLLWSICQAQTGPIVTLVSPERGTVLAGTTATLRCNAMGALSGSAVIWKRNNVQLPNSLNELELLELPNFSSNMTGNYTCVADYAEGTLSSKAIELNLVVFEVTSCNRDRDSPKLVTVMEGVPTAVDCATVNTNIPYDKEWRYGIESLFNLVATDYAVPGINGSLYFTNPTMEQDHGLIFSCLMENPVSGVGDICYIQIAIQMQASPSPTLAPYFVSLPQDVIAVPGDTVRFECIPAHSFSDNRWSYPSSASARTTGFYEISAITVGPPNVGNYTCTIEGFSDVTASLTLIDPPQIISTLSTSVSVIYGEPLSLNCLASPNLDTVQWEWYNEGERIVGANGPTLQVSSTTSEDSGAYQCIAFNRAGYDQSIGTVEVQTVDVEFLTNLPRYMLTFRNTPTTVTVSARGAPPPVYRWLNADGGQIESDSIIFDTSVEGSLTILNLTGHSVDNYTSLVSNALLDGTLVSQVTSQTTLITIRPTTIAEHPPAPIFETEMNSTVYLPCVANHETDNFDITVTYTWTRNGQPLSIDTENSRFHSLDALTGSIFLIDAERHDEGEYQCHVDTFSSFTQTNAPMVSSEATQLRVIDTLVVPAIISLKALSVTTFNIQWVYLGNAPVHYLFEIKLASSPEEEPWTLLLNRSDNAITDVNITHSNLIAYTLYKVRITAQMQARFDPLLGYVPDGRMAPGVPLILRTGEDVPEDSPRDVSVVAGKNGGPSSDIVVSWEPPLNPRGEIINYIIEYRMIKDTKFISVLTNGGNFTSYTIKSDIPKYISFEVKIAAATAIGQGPFSKLVGGSLLAIIVQPFKSSIGFVMIIVALALIVLVSTVIGALILKRIFKKKQAGRYHFRHSGFFGKGAIDPKLSDSAVNSYVGRSKRAFSSTSPGLKFEDIDAKLEGESSFGGGGTEFTYTTGTPQLSVASSSIRLPHHAPSYIDPPPFEEAIYRSRTQSASSGYDFVKQVVDWDDNEQGSSVNGRHSPPLHGVFSPNGNIEYIYDESDNSIEKPEELFISDREDALSDHTQYSHLGPAPLSPPHTIISPSHHHLTMPLSANSTGSGSGSFPITVGEMVHNRLKSQSPEVEGHQFLGYATNV